MNINNISLNADVLDIINKLKSIDYRYFQRSTIKHDEYMCACPFHKNGQEQHPSFSIHIDKDKNEGIYHCFSCGASGNILSLICYLLKVDQITALSWIKDNFDTSSNSIDLEPIVLEKRKIKYLPDSELDKYKYYHDYMFKRGLTEELISKFKIGSTADGKYITFPCWDEHNNLVGIFKRSTIGKNFIIPSLIDKPVYLLNYILNENISSVYVTESQINALTCWKYKKPAIALFGTGSDNQYKILRKSGIRNYILAFDGDIAGFKGTYRFIKNMPDDCIINILKVPVDKDVNDLSFEDFNALPIIEKNDWLKNLNYS